MDFVIDKRLLFYLILTFIITTIIGTVSHECGHYLAGKIMGFKVHLSYGMTTLINSGKFMTNKAWLLFALAGPFQTMVTGTIGFFLLYQTAPPGDKLSIKQWLFVFISLFWLRQPANLVVGFFKLLITGSFPDNGDEINLSRALHIPGLSINFTTALIGCIVLSIIVFKFVPKKQRFTFILSGLAGGIAGYLFWFGWAGQIIMP